MLVRYKRIITISGLFYASRLTVYLQFLLENFTIISNYTVYTRLTRNTWEKFFSFLRLNLACQAFRVNLS